MAGSPLVPVAFQVIVCDSQATLLPERLAVTRIRVHSTMMVSVI